MLFERIMLTKVLILRFGLSLHFMPSLQSSICNPHFTLTIICYKGIPGAIWKYVVWMQYKCVREQINTRTLISDEQCMSLSSKHYNTQAKLQNTGPMIYITTTIVSLVIWLILQKPLTHVNEVHQSDTVFCSCSKARISWANQSILHYWVLTSINNTNINIRGHWHIQFFPTQLNVNWTFRSDPPFPSLEGPLYFFRETWMGLFCSRETSYRFFIYSWFVIAHINTIFTCAWKWFLNLAWHVNKDLN